MMFVKIAGLLLLTLIVGNLWWRWLSRRQSMPCPTLFAGILESAWFERLIGTQTTLDRIGLEPGQRVLEIGPGPGRLLIPAAQRVMPGGEVVGLDIQAGMIERLKAQAARMQVSNLTGVVGDAAQPHFPSGAFDVIFLCTVLGEIPNRELALKQCFDALKNGGKLSVTEIFPDPHFQSRGSVCQFAETSGFRLHEVYGHWNFFTANFIKD